MSFIGLFRGKAMYEIQIPITHDSKVSGQGSYVCR